MSGHNKDERRNTHIDTVLTWSHRCADQSDVTDELLPELTNNEQEVFADGEAEFLKKLLADELEDESDSPQAEEFRKSTFVTNMEPAGLNRAKTVSDETKDVLDRQRLSLIQQHQQAGQGLGQSDGDVPDVDPEKEAATILKDLSLWGLPVDPRRIADQEGIQLLEGDYGPDFDARIEFLSEIQRFAIFHQGVGPGRPQGRVNFSLAHELGHYYLHHEYLLSGSSHNSKSDFTSKDPMEKQADEFAAALLMPRELFASRIQQLSRQICTLSDICKLSEREFHTSVTSTALRYCKCDFEACAVVLSRAGRVLWAVYSTDMQLLNMKFIRYGSPVPADSWSAEIDFEEPVSQAEGVIDADIWFDRPFCESLWEEAVVLGRTGLVLTFLSLPDPELE